MRRGGASLTGLVLLLLAGCLTDQTAPGTFGSRAHNFARVPADTVFIEMALVERRLGDAYLNQEVWQSTDEQVVDLERKATLEDNGFRVGQVVGMIPSGLQALLLSERACIHKRGFLQGPGKVASLELGPTVPHTDFTVVLEGESTEVQLNEAQFTLRVTPTASADGRTRLSFTPQVVYGENLRDFQVAPDGAGFTMQIKRPSKSFEELSWEVTVAPNQYLLVGGRLDQPRRLGHACFVQQENGVQRLLVIRTNRTAGAQDTDDAGTPVLEQSAPDQSPPLALQATLP